MFLFKDQQHTRLLKSKRPSIDLTHSESRKQYGWSYPLFLEKLFSDWSVPQMGCRQSTVRLRTRISKPIKPSYWKDKFASDNLPEPETPPDTDSRLPLNTRQVFKLQKSWKGIRRNMNDTGVELFIK